MSVRLANEKDNEHISKIWQACFTEDKAYIDNYLKFCLPYTKTWILALNNNDVVSCLSIIPSFVNYNNDTLRGGYLYAVGTLPEHRGNSYSKELMAEAIKNCRDDNYSYLIVKPADEKLFAFYIKSSFDRLIFKGSATFNTSNINYPFLNQIETTSLTPSELFTMRDRAFVNSNFLWSEEILNYAILETKSRGGSCKAIKTTNYSTNRPIYFIAYPDDLLANKISVLETNVKTPLEFSVLTSSLKQEFPNMTEMVIDFPSNYMKSQEFVVVRSALLLSFAPANNLQIERFHLSLPLE